MTRDEAIRLAREAGIPDDNIPALAWGRLETGAQLLERFAALVAAAEREECAKVCEEIGGLFQSDSEAQKTSELCSIAIRARGSE